MRRENSDPTTKNILNYPVVDSGGFLPLGQKLRDKKEKLH
jgi:hypothetical protein